MPGLFVHPLVSPQLVTSQQQEQDGTYETYSPPITLLSGLGARKRTDSFLSVSLFAGFLVLFMDPPFQLSMTDGGAVRTALERELHAWRLRFFSSPLQGVQVHGTSS